MGRGTLRSVRQNSGTARAARQAAHRERLARHVGKTPGDRLAEAKRLEHHELKRRLRVMKEIVRMARSLRQATLRADEGLLDLARFIAKRDLNEELTRDLSTGTKG